MLFTLLPILLFILPQSITGEPKFETLPLRFDVIIQHLRKMYQTYPDNLINLLNTSMTKIQPELLLSKTSFFSNQSTVCELDFELLISAASQRQLWALKVVDAWGKPLPSGVLKGNLFWLGNYDECINPLYQLNNKSFVQQPFDTQYCALHSNPVTQLNAATSGLILGLCMPASCTRQDIVSLLDQKFDLKNFTEDYLRCSNDRSREGNQFLRGTIAFSIVLSVLALLVLSGTISDIIIRMYIKINSRSDQSHSNTYHDLSDDSSNKHVSTNLANKSLESLTERLPFLGFLQEFSAIRTVQHIFKIKKNNQNTFDFLNGIRVLSLFWVILGHSYSFGIYYTSNIYDLLTTTRNFAFQLITSGVLSVDTFFLLSGFLTAVLFVRQVKKEQLSIRFMGLYYIHRYLRLTPAFILVMFVSIYLTPYFGHGPLFPIQQGFESEGCRNGNWWTSFLYIGNFFKGENMCLPVTWYLFNDMQFHWIAPLALIPFVMGFKIVGYIMTIIFVLVSIGSILGLVLYYPSLITHALDITNTGAGPNFFEKIYITPWCRISPYAIGLLTGFIVINTGRNYRMNSTVRLLGSILAIGIALVCLFSIYGDYVLVPGLSRASLIAYQTLSRPAWSISVSWLIFLCSINQGGVINQILSLSIWTPLARLNYAAYLIHLTVIFVTIFNQSMPLYYQTTTFLNLYVSELLFSYLTAIVVVIFFENPFLVLEKKIFKR